MIPLCYHYPIRHVLLVSSYWLKIHLWIEHKGMEKGAKNAGSVVIMKIKEKHGQMATRNHVRHRSCQTTPFALYVQTLTIVYVIRRARMFEN